MDALTVTAQCGRTLRSHSTEPLGGRMEMITGCWQGALVSDHGGADLHFALRQPTRDANASAGGTPASGLTVALEGGVNMPARLLEGASHAMVALAEGTRDPESGAFAQLLLEARLAGGHLVGHWLRRDAEGRVTATGHLTATRA